MDQSTLAGEWFTASRLIRLTALIRAIPSRHVGIQLHRRSAARILFAKAGGSVAEIETCIQVLASLGLVSVGDVVTRTNAGDKAVKALGRGDPTYMPLAILRSGALRNQVQALLAVAEYEEDHLVVQPSVARPGAAQLLGIASMLPGFTAGSPCRISGDLRVEIESAWNLREPPPLSGPVTAAERQQVGYLAELYSIQLERTRYLGAAVHVRWVATEDSTAGYDIEVDSNDYVRRIEVKGSRAVDVSFILSTNEWEVAERHSPHMEIHFWPDIRTAEEPAAGYARLRSQGYPLIIEDPWSALQQAPWRMAPQAWRVRQDDVGSTGS